MKDFHGQLTIEDKAFIMENWHTVKVFDLWKEAYKVKPATVDGVEPVPHGVFDRVGDRLVVSIDWRWECS